MAGRRCTSGLGYANQLLPRHYPTDRDFWPSRMGALGITGAETSVNKPSEFPVEAHYLS